MLPTTFYWEPETTIEHSLDPVPRASYQDEMLSSLCPTRKELRDLLPRGSLECFGFRNKKGPRICLKKTFQSCFGDIIKEPIAFMGLVDSPSSMSFKHFSLGKSWMISGKNVSYYLCFSMVLIEIAVGILRESTWDKIHRKNRQGPPPFLPQNGIRGKPTAFSLRVF